MIEINYQRCYEWTEIQPWLRLGQFNEVPVLTEHVTWQTSVHPKIARVFWLDLYLLDDNIRHVMTYDELRSVLGKDFEGTYKHEQLMAAEIWEDDGDDGHVDYQWTGKFRIIFAKALQSSYAKIDDSRTSRWDYKSFFAHFFGEPHPDLDMNCDTDEWSPIAERNP